jgi:hypothetical protein
MSEQFFPLLKDYHFFGELQAKNDYTGVGRGP